MKVPFNLVILDDVIDQSQIDYSGFISNVKEIVGNKVTVKTNNMTKWYGKEDYLSPKDVYKRHAYLGNAILVGRLDEKNNIIFNQPEKCIHQANYQSPDLYLSGFETYSLNENKEIITTYIMDDRDLLVVNRNEYRQESIGYYDKGEIVFWEQYIREI